jgi:hypothetical protein
MYKFKHNVNASLLNLLYQRIYLNIPQCQNNHDIVGMFYKHFAVLFVYTYVKNINDIITGKTTKNINDPLKRQALIRCNKYMKKIAIRKSKRLV